jgi:DNA polymerase III alpha subunit
VGFFKDCKSNINRNRAIYEYDIFKNLTKSEHAWVKGNYPVKKWNNLAECLSNLAPTKKQGGGTSREDRKQVIEHEIQLLINPPYELSDDSNWIIEQEIKFFGCPVSITRVETSDTSAANTTCKEIVNGKRGKNLCVVANVQRISDYKITKGESAGQTMSFLTIEDDSCMLDSVIAFPTVKEKYKYILYEGNNLIFCGNISEKDTSFIINTIHEI